MKYKVGDKVRVKSNLIVGEEYDRIIFIDKMKEFENKVLVVKEVNDIGYYLEGDIYYLIWTDAMLEKIEEDIEEDFIDNITNIVKKLLTDPKVIYKELGQKIQKQEEQIKKLKMKNEVLKMEKNYLKGKVEIYEKIIKMTNKNNQ